jgi:glycosyltransferase involved in cell wall biosynthesis
MRGENIVCFAKDWDDDPTSNTHVMRILARENHVLWLNSIGMRRPTVGSARDVRRMIRRLDDFRRGAHQVAPGLWVASPIALPLPHHRLATRLNRTLLRATIGRLRRQLGMHDFQLWSFLPNVADYADLGQSLLVYYCTDNWLHLAGADGAALEAMERQLCRRADLVFGTSRWLVDAKRPYNPETHLASHGVDHAHFAAALTADLPPPPELADVRGPVLGLIGLIDERIDLGLLEAVAVRHPEWTIAMIGTTLVDTAALARHENVRVLGRQPYARLPQFCRRFSVGLVPFLVNDFTRDINPIKLREYLSAGLPVVATALPEVGAYVPLAAVTHDADEFIRAVETALRDDSPERRHERSRAMLAETWEAKVDALGHHVMRIRRGANGLRPETKNAGQG